MTHKDETNPTTVDGPRDALDRGAGWTTDDPTEERVADEARRRGLPEDEIDEDRTIGGGVMSEGGTAIDRGTGTLDGEAQEAGED